MRRTAILTVLLLAVGAAATVAGARGLLVPPDEQRRLVLWGVPAAALLLSLVLQPRLGAPADARRPGGRLAAGAAALLAFLADQSFLAAGYLSRTATFTSGAQELADARLAVAALWALPACLALGVWGWERPLRGGVYAGWRRRLPASAAAAVSALAGTVLALPALFPEGEVRDVPFVAASLATIVCRELALVLLFARGGLLVAGLYRGLLVFTEAFVIHDWYALSYPAYNYVANGPLFYALRAGAALLALGVVAAVTLRPGRKEAG